MKGSAGRSERCFYLIAGSGAVASPLPRFVSLASAVADLKTLASKGVVFPAGVAQPQTATSLFCQVAFGFGERHNSSKVGQVEVSQGAPFHKARKANQGVLLQLLLPQMSEDQEED